jgi:hypothetical protein
MEAIQETFRTDNTVNLLKVERTVTHIGLEISRVEHKVADRKFTRLYPGKRKLAVQSVPLLWKCGYQEHNALVICLMLRHRKHGYCCL